MTASGTSSTTCRSRQERARASAEESAAYDRGTFTLLRAAAGGKSSNENASSLPTERAFKPRYTFPYAPRSSAEAMSPVIRGTGSGRRRRRRAATAASRARRTDFSRSRRHGIILAADGPGRSGAAVRSLFLFLFPFTPGFPSFFRGGGGGVALSLLSFSSTPRSFFHLSLPRPPFSLPSATGGYQRKEGKKPLDLAVGAKNHRRGRRCYHHHRHHRRRRRRRRHHHHRPSKNRTLPAHVCQLRAETP
ncbi:hypothetical protein PUN28_019472 [Cardiocondyla obscurior]|uniref:Uncharacterized protein n=1 Tax=Cardiocondyla obscurior TaxID=286306 RepID=A0AAW2E8L1_9HYME